MTNIFFDKIVTLSVPTKTLIITTLTLVMLASTAVSAEAVTIDSVTFTPYPLIVGERFTATVQVSDFHPEDTVYFSSSNPIDNYRVSIGSTGTAFISGRAANNPGIYDYTAQVSHQVTPYMYNIEATQKGTVTVTAPPVKPTPTITWNNPADIICGTSLSSTQLNAVATDPVTGNMIPGTFAYTPASGTVLSAGTQTLHVDFKPTNTAYYNTTSKEVTINVLKATPTINWNNPADIKYGTALSSTQLCATSLVIGTFVYTPPTGTILNAGTQTLHVDFTPTDTANYNTASKEVTINVIDSRITPTITWNNPADITYGTALSGTQLNAVATDPVTGNTIPGTLAYTPATETVLSTGTHTLHVDFTPTDTAKYSTAVKDVTINVLKVPPKTPIITWNNPADITYGTALSGTQLNAVATDPVTGNTIPGTFAYTPASETVLNTGTHTLKVDFAPTDSTQYNAASMEVTINVLKATPTITWSNPADIIYGTALSGTQLNAVATDPVTGNTIPGTFVYTPAAKTVLNTGTQTLHVDFTPTDTANYNPALKDVVIIVNKATPEITWSNPAEIISGMALGSEQLNAVASVPGTFVYTPPAGTTMSAGIQTLKVDFTPTDAENYNTASKEVTINVISQVQRIQQMTTTVQGWITSGLLTNKEGYNLISYLNSAISDINAGDMKKATKDLDDFIKEIDKNMKSGKLSLTQGNDLINEANAIKNALNSQAT